MTGTSTTTPARDVDPTRYPDPVGELEPADPHRRAAPDVEEVEIDEAGYGHGV